MGKHCNRMTHVLGCIATVFGVFSAVCYMVIQKIRVQTLLSLEEFNEAAREWDTSSFTELTIATADKSCPPTHPSLVVYDNWPGLEINCYCNPSSD